MSLEWPEKPWEPRKPVISCNDWWLPPGRVHCVFISFMGMGNQEIIASNSHWNSNRGIHKAPSLDDISASRSERTPTIAKRHWDIDAPPRFQRFDIVPPAIGHRFEALVEAYLPTMKSSTLNSWICFGGASLGCQACIACWAIGQWSYWSLGRCPNRFSIWWDQHLKTFVGVLAWLIPMTLLWEMEWRNALAAETFYTRSTLHTFTKTCTYSSWPSCESHRILSWSYVHQSKVMHKDPTVGFTVNQTQCVLLWSITSHQPLI